MQVVGVVTGGNMFVVSSTYGPGTSTGWEIADVLICIVQFKGDRDIINCLFWFKFVIIDLYKYRDAWSVIGFLVVIKALKLNPVEY